MKKSSKGKLVNSATYPNGSTIGLDVSDDYIYAAVIDGNGTLLIEDRIRTREPDVRRWLAAGPVARVALETGTHSRWIAKAARECGHEVLVANARALPLIYAGTDKTDRVDAHKLARLARLDPELLKPIAQRSDQEHADRAVVQARELLVKQRADTINLIRGMVKAVGGRIPPCATIVFCGHAANAIPEQLRNALAPLLESVDHLSEQIREYDERLEHLAFTRYPEIRLMTQVAGVGTLSALTFRLTIGDPWRFAKSRDVGCYLGLQPKRSQSGSRDPQLGITKQGDSRLRRTLVNCAHYILGPFGPDCDLRRWGLEVAARGGNGKKRAVVAVARKLAVLLHRLWVSGEVYEPLHNAGRTMPAAA